MTFRSLHVAYEHIAKTENEMDGEYDEDGCHTLNFDHLMSVFTL